MLTCLENRDWWALQGRKLSQLPSLCPWWNGTAYDFYFHFIYFFRPFSGIYTFKIIMRFFIWQARRSDYNWQHKDGLLSKLNNKSRDFNLESVANKEVVTWYSLRALKMSTRLNIIDQNVCTCPHQSRGNIQSRFQGLCLQGWVDCLDSDQVLKFFLELSELKFLLDAYQGAPLKSKRTKGQVMPPLGQSILWKENSNVPSSKISWEIFLLF